MLDSEELALKAQLCPFGAYHGKNTIKQTITGVVTVTNGEALGGGVNLFWWSGKAP